VRSAGAEFPTDQLPSPNYSCWSNEKSTQHKHVIRTDRLPVPVQQVGQLSQPNRAAACISFAENVSAKSVHYLTSLYPTAQKIFRNAELCINYWKCSK